MTRQFDIVNYTWIEKTPKADSPACINCGDGCGWVAWYPYDLVEQKRRLVWAACADCNDDEAKPKPDPALALCEACGQTRPYCECEHE